MEKKGDIYKQRIVIESIIIISILAATAFILLRGI